MTGFKAPILNDHVSGQHREPRADGGSVNVVNVPHVVQGHDVLTHLVQVDPLGREFHEHTHGFAKQAERPGQDQRSNEQPGDGVRALEPGGVDDDRGNDDAHGPEGVIEYFEEGGAHVEIRVPGGGEHGHGHNVGDQTDHAEDQQLNGGDVTGFEESPDALDRRVGSHRQEQHGLTERGYHLDARESPRAAAAGRAQHHGRGDHGHQ